MTEKDFNLRYLTTRRTARFVTLGPEKNPQEIWFACHGYAQLASTFIRDLSPLDDGKRLIVAPEALSRFYVDSPHQTVGASWMTREDRLNEIEDYVSYLESVREAVFLRISETEVPVTLLGFSQGAATAARWACRSDFNIKRLILWGETLPPELDDERSIRRLRTLQLCVVGGSREKFFPGSRRAELRERLARLGVHVKEFGFEGGHRLDEETLLEIAAPML